jgi:predicted permease
MFTIRNMGGVSLFLLGTTFLWLTTSFASAGVSTTGKAWMVTNALAFATVVGFTAAAWGLFQRASWWENAAIASAVVGSISLVPYWVAASQSGEANPVWNVFVHVLGLAGVFVLLMVPALERWVSGQVMS